MKRMLKVFYLIFLLALLAAERAQACSSGFQKFNLTSKASTSKKLELTIPRKLGAIPTDSASPLAKHCREDPVETYRLFFHWNGPKGRAMGLPAGLDLTISDGQDRSNFFRMRFGERLDWEELPDGYKKISNGSHFHGYHIAPSGAETPQGKQLTFDCDVPKVYLLNNISGKCTVSYPIATNATLRYWFMYPDTDRKDWINQDKEIRSMVRSWIVK